MNITTPFCVFLVITLVTNCNTEIRSQNKTCEASVAYVACVAGMAGMACVASVTGCQSHIVH